METTDNNSYAPHKFRGLGFGILLILVGAVLLGINFGYIPVAFRGIIFSWPSLLIFIGIMHMRKKHQIAWGSIWIIVGIFFLVPKIVKAFPASFPGIGDNFAAVYWPLLLICAGLVFIVFKVLIPKDKYMMYWKDKVHHHKRSSGYAGAGFEKNSIFGGGDHIILDEVFKGGEVNAIFGGMTLDLRRTALSEGDTVLELNAIFGGITLYIPGDWMVVSQVDAIFGGFEDHRKVIEPMDKTRRLIIKGACVFGGGEIVG
jgi:predicted membrane protein